MDETTTTSASAPLLGDWSDPIEDGVRGQGSRMNVLRAV